ALRPMMAKTFEEKTTKASLDTARTAGIESTAKIRSVISTVTKTTKSGVMKITPLRRVRNLEPSYSDVTRPDFMRQRTIRLSPELIVSSTKHRILKHENTNTAPIAMPMKNN